MEEEVFQRQVAVTALRPQSYRHSDGIYTVVFQLGRPKKSSSIIPPLSLNIPLTPPPDLVYITCIGNKGAWGSASEAVVNL